MTTEAKRPLPQTEAELKEQLIPWAAANGRFTTRENAKKGLKSNSEIKISHDAIDRVVDNTLWPGEKRKGNVIYSESKRSGDVYHKVGDENKEYAVKEAYNANDTITGRESYTVVKFEDDPTSRYGKPKETIVVKYVPKSWAKDYVLNKLDSSLPKPKKLEGREKMIFGKQKAKTITTLAGLLSEGKPSQGFSPKELESRPILLYGGLREGLLTDGFMIIFDKKVTTQNLEPYIEHKQKATQELIIKQGGTPENARAASLVDEKLYRDKEFPKTENLIPEIKIDNWEPAGTSILATGDEVAWFKSSDDQYVAVNADKLAFIYKQMPGLDAIKSGAFSAYSEGWGKDEKKMPVHTGPMAFYERGKLKALLMPMFVGNVPPEIRAAPSPIIKSTTTKLAEGLEKITQKEKPHKERLSHISLDENAAIHAWYGAHPEEDKLRHRKQPKVRVIRRKSPAKARMLRRM